MNDKKQKPTAMARQGFLDPQAMDWNLLKSFHAVADLGSLTRAAVALGLSQPTLSRQIAQLESLMGAALFERAGRGLRPTPTGLALVEPAQRMLAAAQALSLAAAAQNQEAAGSVRITASEVMSAYVLPPMLAELRKRHPAIQVELVASNTVDNLLAREADIAIRMVRPEQGGLIARKVADYAIGFYARRDYLDKLESREPVAGANPLARYDWIGFDQSSQLIDGFRQAGYMVDRHFFAFRSDNQIVGWQAVLAGLGVGVGLCRVGAQFGQLERVLEEHPLPPLPVWLTAHCELRDTPRIRAVFDFLSEALA